MKGEDKASSQYVLDWHGANTPTPWNSHELQCEQDSGALALQFLFQQHSFAHLSWWQKVHPWQDYNTSSLPQPVLPSPRAEWHCPEGRWGWMWRGRARRPARCAESALSLRVFKLPSSDGEGTSTPCLPLRVAFLLKVSYPYMHKWCCNRLESRSFSKINSV